MYYLSKCGLDLKDVCWTYFLIKAKQYFINFRWKVEYDAKRVHYIKYARIQIDFMKEFKWITIYRGSQYPYFFHHFPFLKQWSLTTCFDKAIMPVFRTDHVWIFSFILLISLFLRFRFLFLLMHVVLQWYLGYIGLNFLWYFLVWSIATDDSEFLIMVSCHRPSFRCKVSTFYFSEAATGGVL